MKMVYECLEDVLYQNARGGLRPNKKYLFITYLSMDIEESNDVGYIVNKCYENLDFGGFNLYFVWFPAIDQHDIRRFYKKISSYVKKDATLPILSSESFVNIVFDVIKNFSNAYVIEYRASRDREQIYHKYTGEQSNDYIYSHIMNILNKEIPPYDIYRLGIIIKQKSKTYVEFLRKGLASYFIAGTPKNLNDQLKLFLDIFYKVTYQYYSSLPYVDIISRANYMILEGRQPIYDVISLELKNNLDFEKANKILEEIKENYGILWAHIKEGSLDLNINAYNKNDMNSTILVYVPAPKNPKEIIIVPSSEKSKKDALEIYEIVNTYVGVKKVSNL